MSEPFSSFIFFPNWEYNIRGQQHGLNPFCRLNIFPGLFHGVGSSYFTGVIASYRKMHVHTRCGRPRTGKLRRRGRIARPRLCTPMVLFPPTLIVTESIDTR